LLSVLNFDAFATLLSKTVVFNLFHTATLSQPNLTSRPLPKISSKAYVTQLCLHNRKSQWLKIMYNITMLNKYSFIKLMHITASVRETRAVHKSHHSTNH